jgi:hypothetical protein
MLALVFAVAETRTSTAAPPTLTLVALVDQPGTVDFIVETSGGVQKYTAPANGSVTVMPGDGVVTITQRAEPGLAVTSINCTGTTTLQTDLANRWTMILLAEDQAAICTWVNGTPTATFQSPPPPTATATPTRTPVTTATPVTEVAGVRTTPVSAPINLLATPQNAANVNGLAPASVTSGGTSQTAGTSQTGGTSSGLVSEVLGTQITPPNTGSGGLR